MIFFCSLPFSQIFKSCCICLEIALQLISSQSGSTIILPVFIAKIYLTYHILTAIKTTR